MRSELMQIWKDILATAVIGTEHQQLNRAQQADELGVLLSQLDTSDREGMLLNAASIAALYRRAGSFIATDDRQRIEPSTTDEKRRCSARSGQHLYLMLQGEFNAILPEWLKALSAANLRVTEEYLPALLNEGRVELSLRELIIPVLGKRGEWLAKQNADWVFAAQRDDSEIWETGAREDRLFLIGKLRTQDPARARELLVGTWARESARDRVAFLERMEAGISTADEPFLNDALHDRSADVRRAARSVVTRLPTSEFASTVKVLIAQVLTFKKPLLGKGRFEMSLPEDPVGWLKAQGVEIDSLPRTSAAKALGPKAWSLKELIALTPITFWNELFQKSPDEIIKAAFESEWGSAFVEGLLLAVRRDRDRLWIEALIGHWLRDTQAYPPHSSPVELATSLPTDRLESQIFALLKSNPDLNDTNPVLGFLLVHRNAWSDRLSQMVVRSVRQRIARLGKGEVDWQVRAALRHFGYRIRPALLDELSTGWPMEAEAWSAWSKAINDFLSILAFRRDMYDAIAKEQIL